MLSISTEPILLEEQRSASLAVPTMPRYISCKRPAMVISWTGWLMTPFSTQKTRRAARVVARDGVHTLTHQFGNQQSRAHFFQQVGLRFVRMVQIKVVCAAGVARGLHTEFLAL